MFSKIWTFLVGAEQRIEHDVEAIIADLTNTATKLEAAAEAKLAEAIDLTERSLALEAKLEALADGAHKASEKARAVAGKIKDPVS